MLFGGISQYNMNISGSLRDSQYLFHGKDLGLFASGRLFHKYHSMCSCSPPTIRSTRVTN